MGYTPAEILRMDGLADMSLSYKTTEFSRVMNAIGGDQWEQYTCTSS